MRVATWPEILDAFVEERRHMPFTWGLNDCLSFAADLGVAMGCKDLIEGSRGYSTAGWALRKIKAAGYRDVLEVCQDRLQEIPMVQAQRGDVALMRTETKFGYAACVVLSGGMICGPDIEGMTMTSIVNAATAFRVE